MIPHTREPGGVSAGDAELQTDVMRFFAILAICVIALTSLVETVDLADPSRPAADVPATTATDTRNDVDEVAGPTTGTVENESVEAEGAAPVRRRAPATATAGGVAEPAPPARSPENALPVPPAAGTGTRAPAAAAQPPGPALRFASPAAMLRLVANREIRVFAKHDGGSYRLSANGSRFVPDKLPARLYLMAPETVPAGLVRALSAVSGGDAAATWGVSLSRPIENRLTHAVANGSPGLLLIDAAGRIRPADSLP